MNKGFIILHRNLLDSEIWFKPPEYIKLWIYLLAKANHTEKRYSGYVLQRGQCFVSYEELNDQLKYKVGYRNKVYRDWFVKQYMKRLREASMATTTKQPRGVIVTIVNYSKYQDIKTNEATNETTNEETRRRLRDNQSTPSINNNVNNEKEGNNKQTGFDFSKISDLYQLVEREFKHIEDLDEKGKYTLADGLLKRSKYVIEDKGSFSSSQMDATVFLLKELKEQSVKFIMRSIMGSIQSGHKKIYPAYKIKEEEVPQLPELSDELAWFKIFDDMASSNLSKAEYMEKLGVDTSTILDLHDKRLYKDLDYNKIV